MNTISHQIAGLLAQTLKLISREYLALLILVCFGLACELSSVDAAFSQDNRKPEAEELDEELEDEIRMPERFEPQMLRPVRPPVLIGFNNGLGVSSNRPKESSDVPGAILKTDPDLEASLETAERFRSDGNFRVATQIWQALLQRSGDALYSSDGEIYYSLAQQVEKVIGGLPSEGLSIYRINADAESRELLAKASDPNDVAALSKIVQLYFHSSMGDEAAFRLGCIYLDRYDFIGARRMFEKVLNQYPDSEISREQLLLRIAVCQVLLDQTDAATRLVEEAEKLVGTTSQVDSVKESLQGMALAPVLANGVTSWHMSLSNERRTGVMPSPSPATMKSDLVADWQFFVPPADQYNSTDAQGRALWGIESSQPTVNRTEDALLANWKKYQWRPVGGLVFHADRIYFKGAADMTAWNLARLSQISQQIGSESPAMDVLAWRSVWRNAFDIDDATMMSQMIRRSWGGVQRGSQRIENTPATLPEVQFCLDQIHQQISLCNGLVYSIEGPRFDHKRKGDARRPAVQWNTSYRRSRTNYLTAYDALSGSVQWTLPKVNLSNSEKPEPQLDPETVSPFLDSGGFMSAPIPFGEWIIVPVNQGGAISIYALDPKQDGKTIWSSFLCDEPESGAEPCSPIHLALEGSDLFVCTGMGVVFVLDPSTGMVRFAKRYKRIGRADEFGQRHGWTVNRLIYSGWSDDIVIPYGRQMICFASDSDSIFALDRNTGELIWRTEMNPLGHQVDYILGIHNDVLYAGGRETIIAYDLTGEGRMIWGADQMFDGKHSTGRGVLTPDGLLIPVGQSIYHFSLSTGSEPGRLLKRVGVDLGTGAPVGNLFSDGKRLWVHGGNRLYMLKNVEEE
jgi:outer membrane protein assembly factor BamB/tetratricopeptide (TPR) repeat protein